MSRLLIRGPLLLACALLTAAACSDGPVQPTQATPGYYRLVSVDGQALPYATINRLVRSGDLVLRENGEAMFALRASFRFPVLFEGIHTISGTSIEFKANGFSGVTGTIAGDSIAFTVNALLDVPIGTVPVPFALVFRKATIDPVAVRTGTYVMTHDGYRVVDGLPGVGFRVDWDSLTFIDGVFFRQSRRVTNRVDSVLFGQQSFVRYGTYRGTGSFLLLHPLDDTTRTATAPSRDSLFVQNGALVRRLWNPDRVADERYERRP